MPNLFHRIFRMAVELGEMGRIVSLRAAVAGIGLPAGVLGVLR
ncbi:hypothetical protein [Burkholderia sp. IMCC1007]|nr:hypothetical protein [Burkholderia sp. IMCC1007]